MKNHAESQLPPFAQQVLELYEGELAEVRFPDLDLTALQELASSVGEAQREVDALEAKLAAAKQRVEECNATLLARAERALSYARVYAEENSELSARIDAIRKPSKSSEPAAPKKRGRPAKVSPQQSELLENAAE